jgi:purine-binding chemotaxis protein CheW
VIILHTDEMEFGILADKLGGTKSIALSEIRPPLSTLKGIQKEYLKGITKECLIIINAEKILSDHKIIVHEKVEI